MEITIYESARIEPTHMLQPAVTLLPGGPLVVCGPPLRTVAVDDLPGEPLTSRASVMDLALLTPEDLSTPATLVFGFRWLSAMASLAWDDITNVAAGFALRLHRAQTGFDESVYVDLYPLPVVDAELRFVSVPRDR